MKQLTRKAKKGRSTPLLVVADTKALRADLAPHERAWLTEQGVLDEVDRVHLLPSKTGGLGRAAVVIKPAGDSPWPYALLPAALPERDFVLEGTADPNAVALAWALATYSFEDFKKAKDRARLVWPAQVDIDEVTRLARATFLARDLVTRPASHLGPQELAQAARKLGSEYKARVTVTKGKALLDKGYRGIHTVGRASTRPPCLIDLRWGKKTDPKVTLVGKGVIFDSGGLNIKGASGMILMKKDMGGAAHAIALAELVMGANLPVHLKLYIPAVENAIAGNAFRPGDVLSSRKGLSVEIDNTDAEGRLILGDALTRASEEDPELLIDFATLTGAARVALGPELAPFYTDDDKLAVDISNGAFKSGDPAWRMPLWAPYKSMLKSPIADLVNSASGGMAGSITAAIFLKQFVDAKSWVHLDVWAWREGKYGRPAGGAACGLRAVWAAIQARYS